MTTCDQCSDLLWDLLYDLLDAEQAQALRRHLDGCPACRAALAAAEAQKNLVARAARMYETVPPFQAPAAEPPATLPLPAPAPAGPPRRAPAPRPRTYGPLRFAAAAAVLLVAGGTYLLFE